MIVIGLLLLAALIATAAGLAAEDRPHMKRIDVSPAGQDRGEWIAPRGWRTPYRDRLRARGSAS